MPQDDALDRGVGVLGLCIGRRAHHVFAVPSDASISAPSTRRLLDGAAMPVPHHSIDGVIYESLRIRRSICTQAVGDCPTGCAKGPWELALDEAPERSLADQLLALVGADS